MEEIMKNQFTSALLTVVLFASALLNLSCNTTQKGNASPINTTSANNTSVNSAQNSPPSVLTDCSGDPTGKKDKIKKGVGDNIKKDKNLDPQYNAKKFDFEPVIESSGDATLYIWGSVYTSVADLDNLNKTYKDYMKKGCVTKVAFNSAPGAPASILPFEFNICEHPNQICSNGICAENCAKKEENVNSNNRTNSNK